MLVACRAAVVAAVRHRHFISLAAAYHPGFCQLVPVSFSILVASLDSSG